MRNKITVFIPLLFLFSFVLNAQDQHKNLKLIDLNSCNSAYSSTLTKAQFGINTFIYSNVFDNGIGVLNFYLPLNKVNSIFGVSAYFNKIHHYYEQRYGFTYNYKFKISENQFVALGTKFSVFKTTNERTYTTGEGGIIYEEYTIFHTTKFYDFDLSLWYNGDVFSAGLSYTNILGNNYNELELLSEWYEFQPVLNITFENDFTINKSLALNNKLIATDIESIYRGFDISMNNIFELNNTFIFGTAWNAINYKGCKYNLGTIIGFNIADKYKLLVAVPLIKYESEYVYNDEDIRKKRDFFFEGELTINL